MSPLHYTVLYSVTLFVFFAVDIIWLGYVARTFYRKNLHGIISPDVNWKAAGAFYLVYIAGILVFAVIPALQSGRVQTAIVWGGLFGFFTYATYDLTNMATLKNWPLKIVVVDIAWGTVLCSAVATLSFLGGNHLLELLDL